MELERRGRRWIWAVVLLAAVALSLANGVTAWALPVLAFAVIFAPWNLRDGRKVDVTPAGLRFSRWPGRQRAVPWGQVTAITEEPRGWRVETPLGSVRLARGAGAEARSWWQAALEDDEPESGGEPVEPAQMRAWLGLAPGERLEGWRRPGWHVWSTWVVGFYLLLALLALLTGQPADTWVLQMLTALSFAMIALPDQNRTGFCADEHGLAVRDAQHVEHRLGWDAITAYRVVDGELVLLTRAGVISLPAWVPHGGRLAAALGPMLAAREAGAALPRLAADVPGAALSRVCGDVVVERGLSLSSDP